MNGKIILLGGSFGFLLFSSVGFAAEKSCSPKTYKELVNCALSQSLEIQISNQKIRSASELEGAARQWANPDLDIESVYKDSEKSETSASLLFDISLGGKRSALIEGAKAETQKTQATHELEAAQNKLNLILNLYRLAHLKNEIQIEEESVATFTKIVSQFTKKPALSPEQQVSLSVFKMATSDHALKLTRLKSDQDKTLQDIISSTNLSKESILKNLPDRRSSWPEVRVKLVDKKSPHLRFAEGEVLLAKSEYQLAKAESWPEIKIGPAIKMQKEGSSKEDFYGFALSMPLPILSWNGGKRSYGEQKLSETELSLELAERKANGMREQLAKKYQNTVSTLKTSISAKSVEEKHEEIERLFFKGLVASSLVIEAHRQLIELEENKNSSEREALEALGSIYILDNEFSEVIL